MRLRETIKVHKSTRIIIFLALALVALTSCSLLSSPLFYASNNSCYPKLLSELQLGVRSPAPIELRIRGISGPISYLHLFTESTEEEIRIAGVSPILGREFVVSVRENLIELEGAPRFLSREEIYEISALSMLVQNTLLKLPPRDDPLDLECQIDCNSLEIAARCSNSTDSITVDFYDKRLLGRYRFEAQRLP